MGQGLDFDCHSEYLDLADEVVATPPPQEVRIRDPEEFLKRLDSIHQPGERLKHFVTSVFDVSGTGTHEGYYVRYLFVYGLVGGWLFGGFYRSRNFHEEFVRQNNAAAFEGRYLAQRKNADRYMYSVITKGAKFGLGSALLMSSGGFVCLASTSYRNRLYLPDWLVGLGTVGAVSRCWLGMRGVVAGAVLGSSAGLVGYGLLRGYEMVSGESLMRLRYLYHLEWKLKRDAKLDRLKRARERHVKGNTEF